MTKYLMIVSTRNSEAVGDYTVRDRLCSKKFGTAGFVIYAHYADNAWVKLDECFGFRLNEYIDNEMVSLAEVSKEHCNWHEDVTIIDIHPDEIWEFTYDGEDAEDIVEEFQIAKWRGLNNKLNLF